jgi:glycosyltransferase involved in cell wall biosynthesis
MRRPNTLVQLLQALNTQETNDKFTFSVVVVDNDEAESAKQIVEGFGRTSAFKTSYHVEPRQNIARARNRALAHSEGDFIALIDDDEFPASDWLRKLLAACERYAVAGVLGPVRPRFESTPSRWICKGRFFERPEYKTGRVMKWDECRTGNVLFRRHIADRLGEPFNPEFGTGGEDKDFFMRLTQAGNVFVWCNEAIAYETVPPSRCTRSYMLKRALLRGRNILKHPVGRKGLMVRSFLALPVYSLALPAFLLFGQHWFMRYCIKLCDHLGRVLALMGINLVSERPL